MSPCGYGHGVPPCPDVDRDMENLHVSMWIQTHCLYLSLWIWTWSISMCLCGYRHGVSPCFHVDMDMECLHVDTDM